PSSAAAGTFANVEILEENRKPELEDLRIGEARIGHVGVDRVGAVEAGAVVEHARRRARADRLVILVTRVAEGEVVHRALRRGERAERTEEAVGDVLAGLDI